MRNDHLQSHREAFMEHYERYSDDIFRFCMIKTRNRDQALDTTQEAFMKFWEYLRSDTEIEHYRALLYRIARNLIIDQYRKKKDVLVEHYFDDTLQEELSFEPQSQMEDAIDGELALNLLHELPPLTQEIITLRFLSHLDIKEIASVIDKKPNTVSVYLHRGLKKLKSLLETYERQQD